MVKSDFKLLGRIFEAEIHGRLPYQSRSKRLPALAKQGLVEHVTKTLKGQFPITIEGWILTEFGRYKYCCRCSEWCND